MYYTFTSTEGIARFRKANSRVRHPVPYSPEDDQSQQGDSGMSISEEYKARARRQAENMADDFDPAEAEDFARSHQDKSWYEDFILLYRMITTRGFSLSPRTWAIIAGALAYVILPLDVIPDFLPGVGWMDDIAVLGAAMAAIKGDIERFAQFGNGSDHGQT